MREIKFRGWHTQQKRMYSAEEMAQDQLTLLPTGFFINVHGTDTKLSTIFPTDKFIPLQYTGLKDKNGKEYYIEDIGEFDNGDKFILKMEDFLEVYIEWIGEPKCEDQARDLYRIEKAKIIGNKFEHPELLK